jgi:hypothetical protein
MDRDMRWAPGRFSSLDTKELRRWKCGAGQVASLGAISETRCMAMSAPEMATHVMDGTTAALKMAAYMANAGAVQKMHAPSPWVAPTSMSAVRSAGSMGSMGIMDTAAPVSMVTSSHVSCAFGASDFAAGGMLQIEPLMQMEEDVLLDVKGDLSLDLPMDLLTSFQ